MRSEWNKYSPRDPKTYPKDNTRVEMRNADGTQVSEGYSTGHFVHGGVISLNGANLPKRWRYAA
jgi:hypothetical protein